MRNITLPIICISVFVVLALPLPAETAQARVIPQKVSQGDAFAVTVHNPGSQHPPQAAFGGQEMDFSSCGKGCFIAISAVDMDAAPGARKITVRSGKKKQVLTLLVKRAHFSSISLTLPEGKVSLSTEDQARADREAERLQALWDIRTDRFWEGSFVYPLTSAVSTPFGVRRVINKTKTSIHRGLDLRGKEGDKLSASNRGRVALAEELFFGGNTVVIDHGQGIYTVYMHLSGFAVGLNDVVSKGDIIGFVGSSGRASGPHLHFGVKIGRMNVNPVSLVELKL